MALSRHNAFDLEEVVLDNVTLSGQGIDPVLLSVDFTLPIDQTVIVESSNPQNAVYFLQFLAGRTQCQSGRLLWNSLDIFSEECDVDPREAMGCFFENDRVMPKDTFQSVWNTSPEAYKELVEHFELLAVHQKPLIQLSYELQRLAFLVRATLKEPQMLILQDPAVGLSEKVWLDFLDLVQLKQRRGSIRHIYMTNHHPTALRHLSYNKMYIEDGLIYFDAESGFKKAAHF